MGQIIKLNTKSNSKDFNREKFEISIKKEIEIKRQNECKHIEIEVDSDEDLHNCLECGKKFTAQEYLVFKALDNSRIKFHSYNLKNEIHFLEQEKVQLENFVNDLKSQKHKLSSWITRTKNKNNINHNDWNATSNGWKIIAYNVGYLRGVAWLLASATKTKFENITNLTTDNIPPRLANTVLSVAENYKKWK